LLVAAVSIFSVAAVACSSSAATQTPGTTPESTQAASNNVSLGNNSGFTGIPVSNDTSRGIQSSIAPSLSSQYYYDSQTGQSGIWVTGYGSKDVASDVAKVYIGVESKEDTVSEARQKAADAMTAVLDSIRALGVEDDDIVTTNFNIYPQTVWVEVKDSLGSHSEPQITGYVVSNTVEVTVRDLDKLDEVIDNAADQGGDLIRINSISFTVANPAQFSAETRQLAAADAKAKAELYAQAMGVNLGPLVFLTELSSSAPLATRSYAGADAAYAQEAGFAPTPIQSGDVSLSTTIQAAFAIVP
jgi:hypothetical protein